ncbi:MAG: outer membrane beta-barrel protein [Bradyrhizobiaceae bacterium]|nr:outer membrane beta-barrel protein [Bradyrhizobiaceae bacterium]
MRHLLAMCFLACSVAAYSQGTEDVLRPNGRPDGGDHHRHAKHPVVLGLEAGLNVNFYGQSITRETAIENSIEDVVKGGTGFSPMVGLFVDVPLSSRIGIQFRAAYDAKKAGATKSDGIVEADLVPAEGGTVDGGSQYYVDATTESEFSVSMSAATIGILGRFDITKELFLTFGPVINLAFGDVTRTDRLAVLAPDSIYIKADYAGNSGQFKEIERSSSLSQAMIPQQAPSQASTFSTTRVGLELGLGYRFDITKNIYLAPNLRYQYYVTPFTDEYSAFDYSRIYSVGPVPMTFGKATLNTLALVVQLGFSL